MNLQALSIALLNERKRQRLSRTQLAAVSNVSTSFIRDAETAVEKCSLGKLVKLAETLGLRVDISGWSAAEKISDLNKKFDALADGLGIYVVVSDKEASVVATEQNLVAKQAKHTADALLILQELSLLLVRAKGYAEEAQVLVKQIRKEAKQ